MASRKYQKHTHHQHILELPDTYVGSTKTNEETRWIYDAGLNKMVWRKIQFNPGLYKIFDEIVVNARDEFVRSVTTAEMTPIKHIDISVNSTDGDTLISIENDGDGIPIDESAEHGVMIPELIFGHLLTSSNYDKTQEKIVGGKNGYGSKCVSLNTNIPLWSSEIKKAKDIQLGDTLIGDDGTPRTVLNVFQGKGQMYEVQQAAGDSYKVNDQHILTLHMPDHKVIFWNGATDCWTTLWWDNDNKTICSKKISIAPSSNITCPECKTTLHSNLKRHYTRLHPGKEVPKFSRKSPTKIPEDSLECREARQKMEEFCKTIPDNNVFDISIADYMALNDTTKKRLAGVRGHCVQWPKREVELDPYVLGLWLGDGDSSGYGYTCYGEKDPEIIEYLENWGEYNDATLTKANKYHYNFSSTMNKGKKGCAPLKMCLNKYNLINNKHVPKEYLMNDRQTRLAVLAGIIDTDGSVSRNGTRIQITQGLNHTQLANDIAYLARSLGFACHMNIRNTTWSYKGEKKTGEAFNINISGSGVEDIPTRLPRKKCASTQYHNTSKSTGFLTINDAGVDEYVGIQIDGNERFIINDFTVTHNCTNILSKEFNVDIRCPASEKQYSQTWKNNMLVCDKPHIKKSTSSKGYVKISFVPDSSRFSGAFNEDGVIEDMVAIFHTRAVELAALVGNGVKVTWNGTVIPSNTFEKYIKLFLRDGMTGFAYEDCGPRWEVGAILSRHLYSDDEELPEDKHISFVNGINTKKGGKHVDTVTRKVLADFCDFAKKKKVDIKPGNLKHSVVLFINATIVNPSFDSQSKEFLTTPPAEFGSKPEYSGKLVDGLNKLGLLEEAKYLLEAKTLRDAKKTDGKKRSVIRGMTKLEDALLAGTAKSRECTLILTEGDSAATSAISGLKEVGRERWGVFPLRGKLLNVRDITVQKFNANEELTAIKKILGLEQGKTYKDISELRYGRVMVMADQDHDGSHIKGLLMNLFHAEWPALMKMGFLCTLLTPILKTSKGKTTHSFYSIPEFNAWKETNTLSGWKIKYYKGLGTSTPAEAREWFKDLHEIKYEWDDKTDESINLAFNKKQADDRKKWLSHYDPKKMLIADAGAAKYTDFVDNELIHFSNADNIRSLPHLIDGLKPSQRKILYSCFKRNLKDEIRVAQLAGYVSEHAAYHHGEASLNSTIVGMAQNFMGSNNINLLKPVGQFGSRLMGGQDAASPRYIHTYLEEIVSKIFRKEDACLLKYLDDDGETVEPEYYLPVVPLLAINGSVGIGTGYSTDIPPHKPDDIVTLIRHRLTGTVESLANRPLDPWWWGFKGRIVRTDDSTWITKGLYEFDDDKKTITVTELPVGTWTKNYKAFLDSLCESEEKKTKEVKRDLKKAEKGSTVSKGSKGTRAKAEVEPCGLKGFDDLYNDIDVKFVLYFTEDGYDTVKEDIATFEKRFKLTTSWKTTNMTCFDADFNIVKYKTIGDILEAFVEKRLPLYEARRLSILETLKKQIEELDAKRRFIQAILDDKLVLQKKTDEEIVAGLKACDIPALSGRDAPDSVDSYEYVLRMRIDRVKKSAVIELDTQIAEKQEEIERLEAETGSSLWLADLGEFEECWKKFAGDRVGEVAASSESAKVANGGAGFPRRRKPVAAKK
jgi:DNA topoisomerase-2